ncbi:MAG: DMT family transporter [Verrucomicrobiales bacterium]|nr:DMT family transporter [Verrucomicrobiales bacterium]
MTPAILTAVLFAFSAVFSRRAARIFGSLEANFFRLTGACILLGIITWAAFPGTVHRELFWWFFLSGIIGFGLGDVGLFLAYPRLGSRLTLLLTFCIGPLAGALGDWWWLARAMRAAEGAAVVVILAGLAVTILARKSEKRHGSLAAGISFGMLSALGMGFGTALSNVAIAKARTLSLEIPGISQAWQRSTAGLLVAGLVLGQVILTEKFVKRYAGARETKPRPSRMSGCMKTFWLTGTMLFGPVLGVSCYQWAIAETGSSAIVLAVAATSTLIVIPLARVVEGDRPSVRQLGGTLIATAGVVWLALLRR